MLSQPKISASPVTSITLIVIVSFARSMSSAARCAILHPSCDERLEVRAIPLLKPRWRPNADLAESLPGLSANEGTFTRSGCGVNNELSQLLGIEESFFGDGTCNPTEDCWQFWPVHRTGRSHAIYRKDRTGASRCQGLNSCRFYRQCPPAFVPEEPKYAGRFDSSDPPQPVPSRPHPR